MRAGEVPLDEVLRWLDAATAVLEKAARDPRATPQPDLDALLVRAYRWAWDSGLTA
ncbi:MAG: hypothetical protein ACRDPC_14315 [Solirubrobacteraceae bacterium]